MIKPKMLIDCLGNVFELYIVYEFYKSVCSPRSQTKSRRIGFYAAVLISFSSVIFFREYIVLDYIAAVLTYWAMSFMYEENLMTRLFLILIIYFLFMSSEIISGIIMEQLFHITVNISQHNFVYYMQGTFFSKFNVFIVVKIVKGKKKLNTFNIRPIAILLLAAFPIASVFSMYTIAAATYISTDLKTIRLATVSIIGLILANIAVFRLFERQAELEQNNARLEFIKDLYKQQKIYYEELNQAQSETRRIRHDIKNCLTAVSGFLVAGKTQKAKEYIYRYTKDVNDSTNVVDTGCLPVDSILQAKLQKCKYKNIHFDYRIVLPEHLYIDHVDLALLLAEALDNAIEATENSTGPNRNIELRIQPRQDYLFIGIINPVNSVIDTNNLKTNKHDTKNHGYGVKSMKMIADKYSGDINFEYSDFQFCVSILLRNK